MNLFAKNIGNLPVNSQQKGIFSVIMTLFFADTAILFAVYDSINNEMSILNPRNTTKRNKNRLKS